MINLATFKCSICGKEFTGSDKIRVISCSECKKKTHSAKTQARNKELYSNVFSKSKKKKKKGKRFLSINQVVKRIEAYNEANGTYLSYGYFVARGLTDE